MTEPLHTHCIGRSTIQSPEADRSRAFAHHLQFALPRKAMSHNAGAQPTGHAHDARKADFGGTGSRDEKTASDGPENGLSVDTVKRADAWTETASDMLSAWDSYLGGQARDQRENAHRLLLAASFARAQFEDLAALDPDAATGGMLRAFLLALIDPASPDLDHLRASNRKPLTPSPTPVSAGAVKPLVWEEYGECFSWKAPLFGAILVKRHWKGHWVVVWSTPGYSEVFVPGHFDRPEDAKAAAEARILSSIETAVRR